MDLFRNIIGQRSVTVGLSASVLNNKLHHACLFSGPAGVGKEAVALELIKILNCQTGKGTSPYCGECRSCRQLSSFSSDDLIYIFPSINKASDSDKVLKDKADMVNRELKNKAEMKGYYRFPFKTGRYITLPQINEIKFFARYNSINKSRKFVIITSAELMNKEAQNSLLKILEEPPGDLFFILISENPSFLLDTIKSRCMNVHFPPLSKKDILDFIEIYYPDTEKEISADLAENSFGSIHNLSDLISGSGKDIIALHEKMFDFFNKSMPPETIRLADEIVDRIRQYPDNAINMILTKTLKKLLNSLLGDEFKESVVHREKISTDFSRFAYMYRRNINPRLLLINLFLNYREESKKWKNRKIKI